MRPIQFTSCLTFSHVISRNPYVACATFLTAGEMRKYDAKGYENNMRSTHAKLMLLHGNEIYR